MTERGLGEACCQCCNTRDYWHRMVGLEYHEEPCDECADEQKEDAE